MEGIFVDLGVIFLGTYFAWLAWETLTSPETADWPLLLRLVPAIACAIVAFAIAMNTIVLAGAFLKNDIWWENILGKWKPPLIWPKSPIPYDDVTLVFPNGSEITHSVPRPPSWNCH